MSATIIQFVPRPNPERDLSYDARLGHLNQIAVEIANVALIGQIVGVPVGSAPYDDTSPCEYSAPEQDGA